MSDEETKDRKILFGNMSLPSELTIWERESLTCIVSLSQAHQARILIRCYHNSKKSSKEIH